MVALFLHCMDPLIIRPELIEDILTVFTNAVKIGHGRNTVKIVQALCAIHVAPKERRMVGPQGFEP